MQRKMRAAVAAGALLALGGLLYAMQGRGEFAGTVPQLKIDLAQPDVLIQSRKLSALPRELVALPGLNQVLTRDFALYYEEHPDRLTLEGTLRRLAYEHGLQWQDRLASAVLDAPAHLALWSDGKGRLAYGALLLEKNAAARTLEQLAKVALPDSQLTIAGQLPLKGGQATVYALALSRSLTLLAVSSGDRLLVFTHPGMLLDGERKLAKSAAAAAQALLEGGEPSWLQDFALGKLARESRHAVTAKASWLSFGYQHFFPSVHAARFEFGGSRWQLALAAAPEVWQDWPRAARQAWAVLPRGAAACAALPVTWERTAGPLAKVLGDSAARLWSDLLPGAGACWYASAGLYAPTVALRLKPGIGAKHDTALRTALRNAVKTPRGEQRQVVERAVAGGKLWTADVANRFGYTGSGSARAHRVTLLRQDDVLLVSVDHRTVEQALEVGAKTHPALADEFSGAPLLLSAPGEVGRMLQTESMRLTGATPAFRQQVQTQLKPRLDALGANRRLGLAAAGVPTAGSGQAWVWRALTPIPAAR